MQHRGQLTDELRVAERSKPQIKGYVRPEEAAEKGVKAVLSGDDIHRHLTHLMPSQTGWEEIADYALSWATEQAAVWAARPRLEARA